MMPGEETLRRLMILTQGGDRAAYRELLVACQAWLRRYFARRIPDHQREDLVQETLMSLHLKRATYDPTAAFLPWLAAIARYRWVDHLRRVYRRNETALRREAADLEDPGATTGLDAMGLDRMLTALPVKQAEAIRLTKIEELSVAEASVRSGQSPALIKVNVYRGMKRLHRMIEKD